MSSNLPPLFALLRRFNAPICHYKVCSTFDSSPTHGSIGRAIELGLEVFAPRFVPVLVGAPHLRRYVAFGNLFAAAPDGTIKRIDRHPMSCHPVTPMLEADLRLHLRAQTATPIGMVDLIALQSGNAQPALTAELKAGNRVILFDSIDPQTQAALGELLLHEALEQPLFSASSSGLTAALLSAWRKAGLLADTHPLSVVHNAGALLIVSGSCSAVTEGQIRWALANGYRGIPIDPAALVAPCTASVTRTSALESAMTSLTAGRSTILYTALGPSDTQFHGDQLGVALGTLLAEILARTTVRRVLLCGGDTSSHAVQQLGVYALTWIANLQPGAPLCRAHANPLNPHLQDLELVLKGGQVGSEDFFDVVQG